jgi:small subunit ribosomal protein S20
LANNISTTKRIRQNERRRVRNSMVKSKMRSASKKLIKLFSSKGDKDNEQIIKLQNEYSSILDKNAQNNVIHWKKAARLKSRMAKKVAEALS